MVREKGNAFANAYRYIKEQNEAEAKKHQEAVTEAAQKHQDTINRIYDIRESREIARKNHIKLIEDCKNAALSTIIKAIYIEALVPGSLTDNGLFLAESMVDGWIQEKGGASRIIGECKNKTYLLNRICTIAEQVALEDVEEIEADESDGKTVAEKKADEEARNAKVTQMLAQANALIAKATALQNGDESVLDNTEASSDDTAEAPTDDTNAGDDVVDASQPVEEEQDDDSAAEDTSETKEEEDSEPDNTLADPDLGEDKEEEKAEEEAPEEEPKAEEETSEEETKEEESEEKAEDEAEEEETESDEKEDEKEEESEEKSEESEEDVEFDDDSELSEDEDDDDSEDNTLADPDLGDMDEEEAEASEEGEDEDQQEAEEELTGDSLDNDEEVEEDEDKIDNTSIDGENTEPQGKIFDELDKEEEVQKAVELISQRVATAEEDFIKRNAEDKKKIDDLLGKLSDNIKTVEQISDNDSTQSKIAQEHATMIRRQIKNITENRPQSVFERMARKLTESIVKDPDARSIYLAESGRADIGNVVESTKVMYGFLEALRTLQLENVDAQYIENILKSM